METKTAKSERIGVWTTPSARLRLQRAAALKHKRIAKFLLDAALQQADFVLAGQRAFHLGEVA